MIRSIEFKNFRMLRDTILPLGRFTLIVGPNGSGKSTALRSLRVAGGSDLNGARLVTAGCRDNPSVRFKWIGRDEGIATLNCVWPPHSSVSRYFGAEVGSPEARQECLVGFLDSSRVFSLVADSIAEPVELQPNMTMGEDGSNLAVVLDRLRDEHPERFEQLNAAVAGWFPEFDRILFETPGKGMRALSLRRREAGHVIPATNLSQGTLIGLALLTLAWLPSPPPLIGLEEPDRGLHPRLLRDVRDAIYRLAYPEQCGEKRDPVQVVATTHNPYFLDLFKDHPEEIVIAEKLDQEAKFHALTEREDIAEILGDASLGEVWYSGVLGGVPAER